MRRRVPDISKAKRLVGFDPKIGLRKIIEDVAADLRARRHDAVSAGANQPRASSWRRSRPDSRSGSGTRSTRASGSTSCTRSPTRARRTSPASSSTRTGTSTRRCSSSRCTSSGLDVGEPRGRCASSRSSRACSSSCRCSSSRGARGSGRGLRALAAALFALAARSRSSTPPSSGPTRGSMLASAVACWAAFTDSGSRRLRFVLFAAAVAFGMLTHYLMAIVVLLIGAVRLLFLLPPLRRARSRARAPPLGLRLADPRGRDRRLRVPALAVQVHVLGRPTTPAGARARRRRAAHGDRGEPDRPRPGAAQDARPADPRARIAAGRASRWLGTVLLVGRAPGSPASSGSRRAGKRDLPPRRPGDRDRDHVRDPLGAARARDVDLVVGPRVDPVPVHRGLALAARHVRAARRRPVRPAARGARGADARAARSSPASGTRAARPARTSAARSRRRARSARSSRRPTRRTRRSTRRSSPSRRGSSIAPPTSRMRPVSTASSSRMRSTRVRSRPPSTARRARLRPSRHRGHAPLPRPRHAGRARQGHARRDCPRSCDSATVARRTQHVRIDETMTVWVFGPETSMTVRATPDDLRRPRPRSSSSLALRAPALGPRPPRTLPPGELRPGAPDARRGSTSRRRARTSPSLAKSMLQATRTRRSTTSRCSPG